MSTFKVESSMSWADLENDISQEVAAFKQAIQEQEQAKQKQAKQEQAKQKQAKQTKQAKQAIQEQKQAKQTKQAKQEQAKQEQAKQEQAKQEQAKQEQAKQEQAKQEQAKQEQAKQEQAKQELNWASRVRLSVYGISPIDEHKRLASFKKMSIIESTFKAKQEALYVSKPPPTVSAMGYGKRAVLPYGKEYQSSPLVNGKKAIKLDGVKANTDENDGFTVVTRKTDYRVYKKLSKKVESSKVKTKTSAVWFLGKFSGIPESKDFFVWAVDHDADGNVVPIGWMELAPGIYRIMPSSPFVHIRQQNGTWKHCEEFINNGESTFVPISVDKLAWCLTPIHMRSKVCPK